MQDDFYDTPGMPGSVLNPQKDQTLIRDIKRYADDAGLSGNPEFIWKSIKEYPEFTDTDNGLLSEVLNLKNIGKYGIVYHGYTDVRTKFMVCTGIVTRNYKYATYMPVHELFGYLMNSELPIARVLFVPDFFIELSTGNKPSDFSRHKFGAAKEQKTGNKALDWKKELMYWFLQKRQAENKPVVICVSDLDKMQNFYGTEITRFIRDTYLIHDKK